MKHFGIILVGLCLFLSSIAEAQNCKITGVETKLASTATKPAPIIIKTLTQNKGVELYRCDLGQADNRFSLEITWADGVKSFLSPFKGQKYTLRISYNVMTVNNVTGETKNVINYASFAYKDTTGGAKIDVKKTFVPAVNPLIDDELRKLLESGIACLRARKTTNDPRLIERFDLRPFYHEFIQPGAVAQISK